MINWKNVLTLFQITLGYGLLCVYLPSLCLHDFVEEKPLSYRFIFYQACANMYLILWGFILAYLKCFNALTLWLTLVLLPLAITAWRKREKLIPRVQVAVETARTIMMGMYGMHALCRTIGLSLRRRCAHIYRRYIKDYIFQLLGLGLLCTLLLFLYGQYHLTHDGFAYGDENIHFHWAQELLHGNAFPEGLYPHGLHFLFAALSSMFGLTLIRVSLTFGCFNTCLLFCMLYLLLKETFSSKVAVLFGIIFFLLTDIYAFPVYYRYQVTFPMEAGLVPYCIMFYALPRYLRGRDKFDFMLFVLSLGWCIHDHFYTAIAAAFTCVAFGIVFLVPMLKKKILLRVIASGVLGALLGVFPFGVGLALGYPFQASMDWAMSVMEESEQSEDTSDDSSADEAEVWHPQTIYDYYDTAFWSVRRPAARAMLLSLESGVLLTAILGTIFSKRKRSYYLLLLFWGVNWLIAFGVSTGIITLIQMERFGVFFGFSTIPLFVFPAQLLYDAALLVRVKPRRAEMGLAAASLIFFFFMAKDGHVKDDFNVETNIIAEGDIKTCYRLFDEYPDKSWTIVSTTFDLALVRYYGYHYEIVDLVKQLDIINGSLHLPLEDDRIYISTKDIFVVVETKIDQYESINIRRGSHVGADIMENRGDPTPALALTKLPETDLLNNSKIYAYPWRAVVMSKLYYWMEKVKEAYPNEVSVFYQDETVTVYHIHQDEYFPLDLTLDYQADLL